MPWLPRAALVSGLLLSAGNSSRAASPSYSAASIVNSATNTADALAPNTIASIYGVNLSYDTAALSSSEIVGGMMPRLLVGVGVYVAGTAAPLYYVSPHQINFLIPSDLLTGEL